jgi:hypothetical protein
MRKQPMKQRKQRHLEEGASSMGKDPLTRDRRYDDAGNPLSRAPLIDRVSEQGEPEPLPKR